MGIRPPPRMGTSEAWLAWLAAWGVCAAEEGAGLPAAAGAAAYRIERC